MHGEAERLVFAHPKADLDIRSAFFTSRSNQYALSIKGSGTVIVDAAKSNVVRLMPACVHKQSASTNEQLAGHPPCQSA